MSAPDFRVGGRIFATLAGQAQGSCNLMLAPDQQAEFLADTPDLFLPVPSGWGRQSITYIHLAAADEATLTAALRTAHHRRVGKNKPRKRT